MKTVKNWADHALKHVKSVKDKLATADRLQAFLKKVPEIVYNLPFKQRPEWLSELIETAEAIYVQHLNAVARDLGPITAMDSTSWELRDNITGNMSTLSAAMESSLMTRIDQKAAFASHLARMTSLTADELQDDPTAESFYDLARNLHMLRGYLWSAVAPGRGQYWLEAWTADDLAEAMSALEVGTEVYNENLGKFGKGCALRRGRGEPQYSTEDLIGWLQAAWKTSSEQSEQFASLVDVR